MSQYTTKPLIVRHRLLWSDKEFTISALVAIALFVLSLFVNYGAISYATKEASSAATDILLQNLPVINTDIVFSEGALLFVIFIIILLALQPRRIPFTLKSVALFIYIRSAFVVMTHLAPPLGHISTDLSNLGYISSGADLFFSGHTGIPFLMALIFWKNRTLSRFFIFCSIIAAAAVILGHLHYTIDVFSAYFITYGIYNISKTVFSKDYGNFAQGLSPIQ